MADSVIIVDTGPGVITSLLAGGTLYGGWGTGTGSQSTGMTDLFTPTADTRGAAVVDRVTTTKTDDTIQISATIVAASGPQTISEVGLFDAASGGDLGVHALLETPIIMNSGDAETFIFPIPLAN